MMADWMESLARQYADTRRRYPDDRLLIVFDIDGTILDLRHMVCHVLLDYDRRHGTAHFRGLTSLDIAVHENEIGRLLDGYAIDADEKARILAFCGERCWQTDSILASHRPYRGVLEVIRWFQLQPDVDVALNTGRPERLRDATLRSLNALGRACRVAFSSDLLLMNADGNDARIAETKAAAIRRLRGCGYRIFAVVDNEPFNLETMAQADEDGEILFLHAETLFLSSVRDMDRTVRGRDYDITRLFGRSGIPERVRFVWHGVNEETMLSHFLASPMQWCEANVRTDPYGALVLRDRSYCRAPWRREEKPPRFDRFVDRILRHGKSMKLDLEEGRDSLDRILGTLCMHGVAADRLWFNGKVEEIGCEGFRLIRTVFPGATIQCPVDFLAPVVRAMPERARDMLQLLASWGIDRFSIGWETERDHRIFGVLDEWGFAVNIYDIPDLRAFLEAALMLPHSLTARFGGFPAAQMSPSSGVLPEIAPGTAEAGLSYTRVA